MPEQMLAVDDYSCAESYGHNGWFGCRSLTAIGTISMASKESQQLSSDLGIRQTVQNMQRQQGLDTKLKAVAHDILSLLSA